MITRPSTRSRKIGLAAALFAVLGLVVSLLVAVPAGAGPHGPPQQTPVVFVHGHQGSAQQFQSQARRLDINGYGDRSLFAYEYDTSVGDNDQAIEGLAGYIAEVRSETGAERVDLIAHSRGTAVSQSYLSQPVRASTVRNYVNIDGRSAESLPGGVPTLALWGSLQPDGSIEGATNVHLTHLGHTETATSAESFEHIYRFLTGHRPWTTRILPEPPGRVVIEGRATLFPQNVGSGGTVQVWRIDPDTGERIGDNPRHEVTVSEDGSFGPLRVHGRKRYELTLVREGELTYHYYLEPLRRSDRFVRLQVSGPGGIGDYIDRCDGTTALTVTRQREWWGDQDDPAANDRLEVNDEEVLSATVAPQLRQILATFLFDDGCDAVSGGEPPPPFNVLPFLSASDQHLPADTDPITVREVARGSGAEQTLTVPSWPANEHAITLQFNDW